MSKKMRRRRNPIKLAVRRRKRRKRSEGIEGGVRLTGRSKKSQIQIAIQMRTNKTRSPMDLPIAPQVCCLRVGTGSDRQKNRLMSIRPNKAFLCLKNSLMRYASYPSA